MGLAVSKPDKTTVLVTIAIFVILFFPIPAWQGCEDDGPVPCMDGTGNNCYANCDPYFSPTSVFGALFMNWLTPYSNELHYEYREYSGWITLGGLVYYGIVFYLVLYLIPKLIASYIKKKQLPKS